MAFDVDAEIEEMREKLDKIKQEESHYEPKWFRTLKETYFEGKLEQLEAIRSRRFRVSLKLVVECKTFSDKEFSIAEFDLRDDFTVQCAAKDYRRYSDEKKDSVFA